ncbi:MAG: hypothetical protein LBD36_02570 [Holosporales bacterium]|jgi:hypothetical protein|nr:hypothetical protein [Holosporales bacterium]
MSCGEWLFKQRITEAKKKAITLCNGALVCSVFLLVVSELCFALYNNDNCCLKLADLFQQIPPQRKKNKSKINDYNNIQKQYNLVVRVQKCVNCKDIIYIIYMLDDFLKVYHRLLLRKDMDKKTKQLEWRYNHQDITLSESCGWIPKGRSPFNWRRLQSYNVGNAKQQSAVILVDVNKSRNKDKYDLPANVPNHELDVPPNVPKITEVSRSNVDSDNCSLPPALRGLAN